MINSTLSQIYEVTSGDAGPQTLGNSQSGVLQVKCPACHSTKFIKILKIIKWNILFSKPQIHLGLIVEQGLTYKTKISVHNEMKSLNNIQCESKKSLLGFSDIFSQTIGNF